MATSNAVSFGMIEFMSQSSPEDVIGVTKISVYRDASLPPPPTPPIPARHVTCDSMNFGYWMITLFNTYPDDYRKFPNMEKYYRMTVERHVHDIASKHPFPNDERVRIEMHRMLVFEYYWSIVGRPKG